MAHVDVTREDDRTYLVVVNDATTTEHQVTVDPVDYERITGGQVSEEELVRRSFEFLLERESNTMILSSFNLMVIRQYFPEYEAEMKKTL